MSFGQGLEGLEGRIAPGTILVTVTGTNQPTADTTTTQQTTVASTVQTTQQVTT